MNLNESELLQRITINSEICHGKPVIRQLRYPVENIMELLSSGMTPDEILKGYKDLEKEDIQAVLLYVTTVVKTKDIYCFIPNGIKSGY